MSGVAVASLLLRLAAAGIAVAMLVRFRDWRIGFLAALVLFMAARYVVFLAGGPDILPFSAAGRANEALVLFVSALVFATVVCVAQVIREKEGNAARLAASNEQLCREAAERDRTQAALRESERKLSTLMSNLPGMAYRCRNDPSWTMEFCSDGCAALTGYGPADFLAGGTISYSDIIHPDDRERIWREVQEALAAARPFELTYRIVTREGRQKWVWEQGREVVLPNGERRLEGFITDVTQQRMAEDQLRQAQKMEIVGQLTGGVAHDFNNLLMVVIGNLELAADKAGIDPDSDHEIARALRAANRGAGLTQQLLTFSRRQLLQPQRVNLNAVAPRVVALLRVALGGAIAIDIRLAPDLWETLVDPGQVELALLNLALNARDAMPEGGRLVIETANAELAGADAAGAARGAGPVPCVMLAVRDTGCGMTPEVAERAFEPFFTTKDVGKGSGLGLSQVYGFVKQSGGQIAIESQVGRGTTVKLYFPKTEAAAV